MNHKKVGEICKLWRSSVHWTDANIVRIILDANLYGKDFTS